MLKIPESPPMPYEELFRSISQRDPERLFQLMVDSILLPEEYVDWEWVKYHEPPKGLTHEEWWFSIKQRRVAARKTLPFELTDGTQLMWTNPDVVWRMVDDITSRAKGNLELASGTEAFHKLGTYLFSSLMEEAIASSHIEGASTPHAQAMEMLQEGRKAADRSEQMIVNNYELMTWLEEIKDHPLTPDLVCEIHRRITQDTSSDPRDAGRIQGPGEERVWIYGTHNQEQIYHIPPPAEELPDRLHRLCDFANGQEDEYVPPLVRAIIVYFMLAYDHYFVEGNGRTARAVYYWSLLNQGFFLAKYVSISRLLKKKPAQYARSFIQTEQDEGDLTYFLLFHARILSEAIDDLYTHIAQKS